MLDCYINLESWLSSYKTRKIVIYVVINMLYGLWLLNAKLIIDRDTWSYYTRHRHNMIYNTYAWCHDTNTLLYTLNRWNLMLTKIHNEIMWILIHMIHDECGKLTWHNMNKETRDMVHTHEPNILLMTSDM